MTTTLVLTRMPDKPFQSSLFSSQSGRFGTLIVLQGGKVTRVQINPQGGTDPTISAPTGFLEVVTDDGSKVTETARYTTIERTGGYVQLNAKLYKKDAYGLTYETGNSVVSQLQGTHGQCFRVHGGLTPKERAILIHEAPHVGFLLGCIGPRKLDDYSKGYTDTAHGAMLELFRISPKPSQLFVLDA